MTEEWKPIAGYAGYYEAGNHGHVRSVTRLVPHGQFGAMRPLKGRLIREWTNSKGYQCVALSKNGKVRKFRVHNLICDTFHPNPDSLPCVNHKNGIKSDNSASNLEHSSYSANNQHAFDTGLNKPTYYWGEHIGTSVLTEESVRAMRSMKASGQTGITIARHFKVSHSTACRAINGDTWANL